jgi:hypothetical protein
LQNLSVLIDGAFQVGLHKWVRLLYGLYIVFAMHTMNHALGANAVAQASEAEVVEILFGMVRAHIFLVL